MLYLHSLKTSEQSALHSWQTLSLLYFAQFLVPCSHRPSLRINPYFKRIVTIGTVQATLLVLTFFQAPIDLRISLSKFHSIAAIGTGLISCSYYELYQFHIGHILMVIHRARIPKCSWALCRRSSCLQFFLTHSRERAQKGQHQKGMLTSKRISWILNIKKGKLWIPIISIQIQAIFWEIGLKIMKFEQKQWQILVASKMADMYFKVALLSKYYKSETQMGKKQRKGQTYTTAQTFKINKKKTLDKNLEQYRRILKAKHSDLSTSEYLAKIHEFISKFKKLKGGLGQQLVVETGNQIKVCRKCDKWAIGTKKMVRCTLCDDSFHIQCTTGYKVKDWRCDICVGIFKEQEEQDRETTCWKCKQNKNQSEVKCLKCRRLFHKTCYDGSKVVCGGCNKEIETKIKKQRQLTLGQSFKRAEIESSKKKNKNDKKSLDIFQRSTLKIFSRGLNLFTNSESEEKQFDKQACQSTRSTFISGNKNFTHSFPPMTAEEISQYKQKLLFAILSKNMEYCQNLVTHNCSLFEDDEHSIDFAVESLSLHDTRMFKQYKKQPIGPFLLEYREECGYDVVADKDLPSGMIVCEYVGDVYTDRQCIRRQKDNDSVMELKLGKNADYTLLIVPTRYTNIARFLNGINTQAKGEDKEKEKKKQNVSSKRTIIEGRPAVILYTIRKIKKGESLMYNYGAGQAPFSYDTKEYK